MSGKKALLGTIVHKVLELCAQAKLAKQEGKASFYDEDLKRRFELLDFKPLSNVLLCCHHYNGTDGHDITENDYNFCYEQSKTVLMFRDGFFSPLKRNIVKNELKFDLELYEDWAVYNYIINGQELSGQLRIRGTIDLVTKEAEDTLWIIDYKTGRRTKYPTSKYKDFDLLRQDIQFRLYHYALSRIYPDISAFVVTVYYTSDGGPYTVYFEEKDIPITLNILRKYFEHIKRNEYPRLNKGWWCEKVCYFGKTMYNETQTICEHFRDKIHQIGMRKAVEQFGDLDRIVTYGNAAGRKVESENKD